MRFYITILFFVILSALQSCKKENSVFNKIFEKPQKPAVDLSKTQEKAKLALEFCKKKDYNQDFCILIDMSLHSGVKRLFVWDFKKSKISKSFLVGHGCGNLIWSLDLSKDSPTFSNENDSHCSSLGKYKIGERGYSNWGVHIKYVLHGLEETNSNAEARFIVFHSWEKMNNHDIFPKGSPEGWGCPTISDDAMLEIDPILQKSKKSVLMWIYNH